MGDAGGGGRAEALFEAGLACLGDGDFEGAVMRLGRALEAAPGHVEAWHGLVRALDQAGRGEEALAAVRGLIAAQPDDVLARTSLSMILQRMGRIEEAEKAGVEAKLLGWKMELRQGSRGKGSGGQGSGIREQGSGGRGFEGKGSGIRDVGPGAAGRWFVASSNAGKLRDFAAASGGRVRLEALPGLAGIAVPAEEEDTFAGNAAAKAVYYSGFAPGVVVVADDSGLEVDALDGGPGVRSARFAEDLGFGLGEAVDERNNLCLLAALRGVEAREGRYRCVLAAARDGALVTTGEGSVKGTILTTPRGNGGFGYDPLFFVVERGKTMAEMSVEERLGVSHRGRALAALLDSMESR